MIAENLQTIETSIAAACKKAGRPRDSVQLIAVSKTKPAEMIEEAYAAGQRLFGENRPQEITAKKPLLPADIQWHMIGNLQRNKVKYVTGQTALIHSVASLPLAEEIERLAAKRDLIQEVLVEINVAGEESKQGADLEEARALVAGGFGISPGPGGGHKKHASPALKRPDDRGALCGGSGAGAAGIQALKGILRGIPASHPVTGVL